MNTNNKSIAIVSYKAPGKTGVGTTAWNHARMLADRNYKVFFITPKNFRYPNIITLYIFH